MYSRSPQSSSPSSAHSILRRRDKRHLNPSATTTATTTNNVTPTIDHFIRDPFDTVSLAVSIDAQLKEDLLEEPLKSANFHDSALFSEAYMYVSRIKARAVRVETKDMPRSLQGRALTPIVLAGLLHAIQEKQQYPLSATSSNHSTNNANDQLSAFTDISAKLVAHCEANRAIARERRSSLKKQRRIQKLILPSLSLVLLIIMYYNSSNRILRIIQNLDIPASCDRYSEDPHLEQLCFRQNVLLWKTFREYILRIENLTCAEVKASQSMHNGDPCHHPLLAAQQRYGESPLSFHTPFEHFKLSSSRVKGKTTRMYSLDGYPPGKKENQRPKQDSLGWLGYSSLNQHAIQAIESSFRKTWPDSLDVIDIGAGIGGTLFALLDQATSVRRIHYRGVSLSPLNKRYFDAFVHFHRDSLMRLEDSNLLSSAQYEVGSIDKVEAKVASVVFAVEALSLSQNITKVIRSSISALRPGGLLVFVDMFRYSDDSSLEIPTHFSSILDVSTLVSEFKQAGCSLEKMKDITLENAYASQFKQPYDWDWLFLSPWKYLLFESQRSAALEWALRMQSEYRLIWQEQGTLHQMRVEGKLGHLLLLCRKG